VRALALLVAALVGCHAGTNGSDMLPALDPLIAARPYGVTLPAGHDPSVPSPLIVVLHGYMANGSIEDSYLGVSASADAHHTIIATPDGTIDQIGNHFWNATDACCDVFASGVDDVAYLTALIADAVKRYGADPTRVFLLGHSNGAFMAHRMACDRADRIAAIAALAGDVWLDMSKCRPSAHLAVAQIQGDADSVVLYKGGQLNAPNVQPYPGSEATFQFWSMAGACSGTSDAGTFDYEASLPGNETTVTRATGCATGAAAELWRIVGGQHVPTFTPSFMPAVYAFFEGHPRQL
jgi:polyhydroxybutyrate depolymerase